MPSQVFTNVQFVTNATNDSWAAVGSFPAGTQVTVSWIGAHVTAPCGQYGYACLPLHAVPAAGGTETRFAVTSPNGSVTDSLSAFSNKLAGTFFTDGFCSPGVVDQVTVTWTTVAVQPCEHGTRLQGSASFTYYLTPALIDTWLTAVGLPWLAPIFTAFYFSTFNAQDLCAAGPPPMPTIDLSTLSSSVATVQQILEVIAWPNVCECVPGTPAPIPYPPPSATQPVGWPTQPTFSCQNVDVCATLIAMQKQLAAIAQTVGADLGLTTLIQRYNLPFAYIRGAVHSNLSGAGSFAVTRLVGLEVEVTAADESHRHLMGTPPYIWNLGWLSVSDGDGMLQEQRITVDKRVWLPPAMDLCTLVGYSVGAGTTLRITELEAEP